MWLIKWLENFILIYFLWVNISFFICFVYAAFAIVSRYRESYVESMESILNSNFLPKITFIMPVYEDSHRAASAVSMLLGLPYNRKEIIIVDDGSKDGTMQILKDTFSLLKVPPYHFEKIKTEPIISYYVSEKHPNLTVIEKMHGGKPDALNAAVNACKTPYYVACDIDTVIDDKILTSLIRPFFIDPDTLCAGATVRPSNGCKIISSKVVQTGFPTSSLAWFQIIEYLREFYVGRLGFQWSKGPLMMSSAFSLFNTDVVKRIGGYDRSALEEDIEIVFHLHQYLSKEKTPYRITFVPDPVAWTHAPEHLKELAKERIKWNRGLLQTVWKHKTMFLNPRYGAIGLWIFPYCFFDQLITPFIELLGYLICIPQIYMHQFDIEYFLLFFSMSLGLMILFNMLAVLLEVITFNRFTSIRSLLFLFYYATMESIGYRQLTWLWKIKAVLGFVGPGYCETKLRS